MKKIFILFIILPFILCGCWDQALVEDTGFITIVGIESSSKDTLNLTYAMPVIDPTITVDRGEILDTESSLLREGRDNLNRISAKRMLAGKVQLVLYSKEIARNGLVSNINSIFEKDPSDAMLAWVIVVDGSPRDLIHKAEKFKDKPLPSAYMTDLLQRSVDSVVINETRIFNYDIRSMSQGIDNTAPFIKLTPNSVQVEGSALFSKDKMVGTINRKDSGLLLEMMNTLKSRTYTYIASDITSEDDERPKHGLAIAIRQKSKKINLYIKNGKPVVDINLNLTGTIDEYKWDDLNDDKKVKQLNEHIQAQIQEDCQKLLEYLQSIKSDPIGIGDMVRAKHNAYFKRVDWHEIYKAAAITAHVKFNIIQHGAIH